MTRLHVLGTTLAVAAAAAGLAACGGATQGNLHAAGSECKASYTVHGGMVNVRVNETGPATVEAIVTDLKGQKHGATAKLQSGQNLATLSVAAKPPVKRVEVKVSESSGQTNCVAAP